MSLGRNYPRLEVVPFGKQLFASKDLDPIYPALIGVNLMREPLAKWLISYWLFYSAGGACWASELPRKEFWKQLAVAAENAEPTPFGGRWPRGSERRHFRGAVAVEAVKRLEKRYGNQPEGFLDYLCDGALDVKSVVARAREHYLFGSWIAFKVADMLDAVWGASVVQDDLTVFLYDTPRQSIVEKWKAKEIPITATDESTALVKAMEWLRRELRESRIPHKPGQSPDWFSLETVWCKHLSHMHGHYPLGKDITEITHGLQDWKKFSPTAVGFAKQMPRTACLTLQ